MEDRFASIAKTTSGWVYIVKYFAELEIKHDKGNFEKAAEVGFKGFPFSKYFRVEEKNEHYSVCR